MKKILRGGTIEVLIAVILALNLGAAIGYLVGKNRISAGGEMQAVIDSGDGSSESDGTTIGGAKVHQSQNITDGAASTPSLTNLVAALRVGSHADLLATDGPYTLFAPTNDAIGALPGGIESLLSSEKRASLKSILDNHLVRGAFTTAELKAIASRNESLTTLNNQKITFSLENNAIKLSSDSGNIAQIEAGDAVASNGIIHAITTVLVP